MNVHYAQGARDYQVSFDVELVITRAPSETVSDAMRSMPEAEADPATRRLPSAVTMCLSAWGVEP